MEQDRYYHIFNRGNNSDLIFYEEENYDYFIKKYRFYLDNYVETLCYCLMRTHFHFLIKVININWDMEKSGKSALLTPLEKAFKDFFISYAKSINKKYHRTGSLFQYKFKRKEITDQHYLKNIIRYIHYNPIASGYCKDLNSYRYGSYHTILTKDNSWLAIDEVIGIFGDLEEFKYFHHQSENVCEEPRFSLNADPYPDFKSFINF